MSVAEIAGDCGYRRLEAFNRAFERAYRVSPSRFRRYGGDYELSAVEPEPGQRCPVVVEPRPAWDVITLTHRGAYAAIGRAFDAMEGWLVARGTRAAPVRSIGLMFDDPLLVAEPDLESRAGIVVSHTVDVEWPLECVTLTARDYAVATFTGPLVQLRRAYRWLYGEWLPESGRWVTNEPIVEEYVTDPRCLETGEIVVRIGLPLESADRV